MDKTSDQEFEMTFFESVLKRSPDYTEIIEILGGLYTKHGRISDGLKMDRKLVRYLPENATAHYNLACSLALSKREADALKSLRRAIELGYQDIEWLMQDSDLTALKEHPDFDAVIAPIASKK